MRILSVVALGVADSWARVKAEDAPIVRLSGDVPERVSFAVPVEATI
jgi:hypothetical protein